MNTFTKFLAAAWAGGLALAMSGCAVVYDSQQAAALKACEQLLDWADRQACVKKNQTKYDDYDRQRQAVSAGAKAKEPDAPAAKPLCFKRASTGELVCPN